MWKEILSILSRLRASLVKSGGKWSVQLAMSYVRTVNQPERLIGERFTELCGVGREVTRNSFLHFAACGAPLNVEHRTKPQRIEYHSEIRNHLLSC